MFPIVILYTIGWILTLLASCMLLPVLFSLASEDINVAQSFLVVALVLGFVGGAVLLALKDQKFSIDRKMELVIICTIWFVAPVCAALPLILTGFPDTLNAALFEAVSGFTTTGATVFVDLADRVVAIGDQGSRHPDMFFGDFGERSERALEDQARGAVIGGQVDRDRPAE